MANNKTGANTMRAIIIGSIVLTACGSESSKPKFDAPPQPAQQPQHTQQWGSLMLENAAALPACSAERKGWLAYLKDVQQFQACDGLVWSVADIKGKDGVAGKDGAAGTNGKDGTDNKIVSAKYCSVLFNQFGLSLILSLKVTETASGDVTASCLVRDAETSVGSTEAWPAGSNGAQKASCVVHTDVDFAADFGSFVFDRNGVVYSPQTNAPDNQKITTTFVQSECI